MAEPPIPEPFVLQRLAGCGLGRLPDSDHPLLERSVRANDEAAARVRVALGFDEEPSNVFRLSPAPKGRGA